MYSSDRQTFIRMTPSPLSMGIRSNFSRGQRGHFAYTFQVADDQARNQLGTPGGAKSFLRGA